MDHVGGSKRLLDEMVDQIQDEASVEVRVTSFEAFFTDASSRVYRGLFASLGDADLAEEATAEAFTRACARWDEVAGYANPAGWTFRVGLNWATSRLRRRRFRDSRRVPDRVVEDPEPFDPVLVEHIRKLSRHQIEVIVLRYFFDLDQQSISKILAVPVGTVRSRLSRALAILGQRLGTTVGDAYED